eukprot:9355281-Prorocentrum_lima.AAC.1
MLHLSWQGVLLDPQQLLSRPTLSNTTRPAPMATPLATEWRIRAERAEAELRALLRATRRRRTQQLEGNSECPVCLTSFGDSRQEALVQLTLCRH